MFDMIAMRQSSAKSSSAVAAVLLLPWLLNMAALPVAAAIKMLWCCLASELLW
jgi:hypothetical protein